MKLTYIKQAGEPNGDAGDQYTGLDRFGRVVDQRWPEGSSELERVDYGFTPASNRQWRQNLVAAGGQDEYYNYDGLYQVAELNRGTLNSGKTAISGTPSWTEDFTYDPIGNWDAYLTKVSGVTDLDQTRTHNTANQTTEIDESTDNVAHDLAGNMVKTPQVNDWESANELKWDAWNRLVEVADGETVVAEYRYDGITRRIRKETDDTRHYYYSDRWQILEERLDSETTADRQFIWGQRYVDDLVLRDRDVDNDGSMDERLYVLSDYFNPTAIADEDGVVVERYGYNAFGLSRVMDADFEPRSASDFDWETRYGAYRWDGETGFYQVRFRYLHPTLGRWLRRDPIEEFAGKLLYAYVRNVSINYVDQTGLVVTDATQIQSGKVVFSCNCGWIDWSHVVDFSAAAVRDQLPSLFDNARTAAGKSFLWSFSLGEGILRNTTTLASIDTGLTRAELKQVLLLLLKQTSLAYEAHQELAGKLGLKAAELSAFEEGDLTSNILGYYMAIHGFSQADIEKKCGVIKDPGWTQSLFEKIGSVLPKNKTFEPTDFWCESLDKCPNPPAWPAEFSTDTTQIEKKVRIIERPPPTPLN